MEVEDDSVVVEANGNGVVHHSPPKSNSSPSEDSRAQEARKPDFPPIGAVSIASTTETRHENGDTMSSTEEGNAENSKGLTPEEELQVFRYPE